MLDLLCTTQGKIASKTLADSGPYKPVMTGSTATRPIAAPACWGLARAQVCSTRRLQPSPATASTPRSPLARTSAAQSRGQPRRPFVWETTVSSKLADRIICWHCDKGAVKTASHVCNCVAAKKIASEPFACALLCLAVYGQLGIGSTSNVAVPTPVLGGLSFASIAASYMHACGALDNSTGVCWGRNVRIWGRLPRGEETG